MKKSVLQTPPLAPPLRGGEGSAIRMRPCGVWTPEVAAAPGTGKEREERKFSGFSVFRIFSELKKTRRGALLCEIEKRKREKGKREKRKTTLGKHQLCFCEMEKWKMEKWKFAVADNKMRGER
ncbi:MAG: hypothetical protein K5683_07185 [Prevotella sp.]|nr:hypothetical protein [Prevotella sp.]